MKKTLATLALAGLILLGGCSNEKNKKINDMHIGQRFDYSLPHTLVEENREYQKYKVKSSDGVIYKDRLSTTWVTVKNDTIVSIWRIQ